MDFFEREVTELFERAGIQVNGPAPHDIAVHNPKFYRRFLTDRRLGLGESYMDGWWDCERIDEMMYKLYSAQLKIAEHKQTPSTILSVLASKILPQGSKSRSHEIGKYHYDLGNELFEPMLGPSMVAGVCMFSAIFSCAEYSLYIIWSIRSQSHQPSM